MSHARVIVFGLACLVGCGDGQSAGSGGGTETGGSTDSQCGFDQWEPAAPMLANRAGYAHAVTLLPDGTVLATGGRDEVTGERLSSAERYDPATDEWSPLADMPVPREGHTQVVVADGTVLVIGGSSSDSNTPDDSVERYDPALDQWLPAPSLPVGITHPQAVAAVGDGVFLASWDTFLRSEDGGESWSVIAAPPDAYRLDGGVFRWGDDAFVIPGAVPLDGARPVQIYRWSTDSWMQVPSVDNDTAGPRYQNAYGPLSATRMLVVMTSPWSHGVGEGQGGLSFELDMNAESWSTFTEAEFYTDTVRVAALPYRPGWLWVGDGAGQGHVYEDATDRWCETAVSEATVFRARSTILADGRILFTGGEIEVDGQTRTLAQIWSPL